MTVNICWFCRLLLGDGECTDTFNGPCHNYCLAMSKDLNVEAA